MNRTPLEVTIDFHAADSTNEPVGATYTLVISDGELRHVDVAGGSGETFESLSPETVVGELTQLFDRADLNRALAPVLALQSALEDSL